MSSSDEENVEAAMQQLLTLFGAARGAAAAARGAPAAAPTPQTSAASKARLAELIEVLSTGQQQTSQAGHIGDTGADGAVGALLTCTTLFSRTDGKAFELLDAGVAQATVTCMLRHKVSPDVLQMGAMLLNQLGGEGSWERLGDELCSGGRGAAARSAEALIAAGHVGNMAGVISTIGTLINDKPQLAPPVVQDRALMEEALRLATPPPPSHDQRRRLGVSGGYESGVFEARNVGLVLFSALGLCNDRQVLDKVVSLPGLVPTLLGALRAAHAAGSKIDMRHALYALSRDGLYYEGDMARAVASSGDTAAFSLILKLAADKDDLTARLAAALCCHIEMATGLRGCNETPAPGAVPLSSPLARCPAAVVSLIAAIIAPYNAPHLHHDRDEAAGEASSALAMVLTSADHYPAVLAEYQQTVPAVALDLIKRLPNVLSRAGGDQLRIASLINLLSMAVEAPTLMTGRPDALARAIAAAARAAKALQSSGQLERDAGESIDGILVSVLRRVNTLVKAAVADAERSLSPRWIRAQLEPLIESTWDLLGAIEALSRGRRDTWRPAFDLVPRRGQAAAGAGAVGRAPAETQPRRKQGSAAHQQGQQQQQQQQQQQVEDNKMAPSPLGSQTQQGPSAPIGGVAATELTPACGSCGAAVGPGGNKLKLCSGCRAERYCCQACAIAAWPAHKKACRAAAKAAAATAGQAGTAASSAAAP